MSDPTPWEPQHRADGAGPSKTDLEDLGSLDRSSRIGRTAVQVGTPAAVVSICTWLARLAGLDLDPGAGVDMPAEIVAAWVAVASVGMSLRMNRQS